MSPVAKTDTALLVDLRGLIEQARQQVAQTANSTLTLLYWQVGQRIYLDVLAGQRASYGEEILPTLSAKLEPDYGRGFSARNLARMIKFAEVFPDEQIVVSLVRELNWSHFIEILPLKQPLEREYYAELCRVERWSVRTLRERIGSQLYLRTAISKKPEAVIQAEISHLRGGGQMTPDRVFATRICSIFSACPMATASAIWSRPSCARWSGFCWNWAQASPSWRDKNASRSARMIFISIYCSITGTCVDWWRWS